VCGVCNVFYVSILGKVRTLLVKGAVHPGMKETRERTTMITSGSSDVSRLKKIPYQEEMQKMMDKSMIGPLSVSKSRDVF